jgi:hypothetical protein
MSDTTVINFISDVIISIVAVSRYLNCDMILKGKKVYKIDKGPIM